MQKTLARNAGVYLRRSPWSLHAFLFMCRPKRQASSSFVFSLQKGNSAVCNLLRQSAVPAQVPAHRTIHAKQQPFSFLRAGMLSPDEKRSVFLFDNAATGETDDVESPSPASTTSARSFSSDGSSEWSNADMDPSMVSRSRVRPGDGHPSPPKRLSADVEFLSRGSLRWRKS